MSTPRIALLAQLLCCCLLLPVTLVAQETRPTLRVVTSEIPPCVMLSSNKLIGFSIDLWDAVADDLKLDYELERLGLSEKLAAVRNGEADLAIGGITVTRAREQGLDFSLPTLDSGLRVAVRKSQGVLPRFGAKSLRMLGWLLFFLFLFGHILWWAERGQDAIQDAYFPGIFEAFWCVFATMTTVGYGDIAPKQWLGRFMAILIMMLGISLFSILAATITADFLRESDMKNIRSHQDLLGLRTGCKAETVGADFLTEMGISPVFYPGLDELVKALEEGEIDALIYDEPAVLYLAARNVWMLPVGDRAYDQYYAFAAPEGSVLLEDINRSLLKLRENGVYEQIHRKWFR